MAKLPRGIFGAISGKIGPIIGACWKGIPYIRSTPRDSGKPKKFSDKQLAQQARFAYLTRWLVPFHPYLTLGFKKVAVGTTEISAAFSYNYKAALVLDLPELAIDYSKVLLSKGTLPEMHLPQVTRKKADQLRIDWSKNPLSDRANFDDQLILVVYSRELDCADGMIGGTSRTQRTCTFTLDELMVGRDLDVYVNFWSVNGKDEVSNSQYLGRIPAI